MVLLLIGLLLFPPGRGARSSSSCHRRECSRVLDPDRTLSILHRSTHWCEQRFAPTAGARDEFACRLFRHIQKSPSASQATPQCGRLLDVASHATRTITFSGRTAARGRASRISSIVGCIK